MKINEKYERDPSYVAYVEMLVQEKSKLPKISGTINQCVSTSALLKRDPSKDEEHFYRHIDPIAAFADKYYVRDIPIDQIIIYENMRRKSKNTLGNAEGISVSKERREKAIAAYRFTKPTKLNQVEIERVTRSEPIKELKQLNIIDKKSLWDKIKGFFVKKADQERRMSYMELQEYFKEKKDEN